MLSSTAKIVNQVHDINPFNIYWLSTHFNLDTSQVVSAQWDDLVGAMYNIKFKCLAAAKHVNLALGAKNDQDFIKQWTHAFALTAPSAITMHRDNERWAFKGMQSDFMSERLIMECFSDGLYKKGNINRLNDLFSQASDLGEFYATLNGVKKEHIIQFMSFIHKVKDKADSFALYVSVAQANLDNQPNPYASNPKNKLDKAVVSHISSFLFYDLPLFNSPLQQKNRLLRRLAQYAAEGNINKVVSLLTIRPELQTEVLFALAGLGEQDYMEPILKKHPEYLLLYRPLRDISGKYFPNITLFQHAIWTKYVRYMANMMLDCLPKNKEGERLRLEMVRHYEEIKAKVEKDSFKAGETYITDYKHWTRQVRKRLWSNVGKVQILLPAHIHNRPMIGEGPNRDLVIRY